MRKQYGNTNKDIERYKMIRWASTHYDWIKMVRIMKRKSADRLK